MALPRSILLDTGPLVAVLDAKDQWHARCLSAWPEAIDHCVTVEAVVTEACHLVLRGGGPASAPLDFLLAARIPVLGLEPAGLRRAARLMRTYSNLPMDFADAALVAVAEALEITTVFTTDRRGFSAYRASGGGAFSVIPDR